ncbi:MAG: nucleotidyltransferase family protein [Desulfuromonadales bacterium]
MKAVILAGGRGTRLKSVVHGTPKPMAPVNGRPFLEFLISRLVSQGINNIILSVGHMHEQIMDHFEDGKNFHSSITYCVEHEPLGTGGAVREALLMADSGDLLVMNGDTFVAIDIEKLVAFHRSLQVIATMAVIPVDDASRYGTVNVSPTGLVTTFTEKNAGGSALINSGVYIFNKRMIDAIPPGQVSLETAILPPLAITGHLAAHCQDVPFIDIGVPSAYREFCLNSSRYVHVSEKKREC